MRHSFPFVLAAALLIGACGAQPAAEPATQPAPQPATAPAATAGAPAATEDAFLEPSSVPAPSPTPPAPAGTPAAEAAPTARLILPPASAAPATDEPPVMTLTPSPAAASAGPRATAAQAAPADTAEPAAAAAPSLPVRLQINDIAFDGRIVSVGLDKDRVPIVPEHDVGWYNLSAQPGEGDNIVLWGHVLRFRNAPKIPAPFARLKELKPGAAVTLYDKNGGAHAYVVTKQVWVTPDQVEYILPKGKEMVTMVSCIGDKIIEDGEVVDESHRLITIAEPAP